ncbi:hypothetical protein [Xenorhabdus bovienii]|nr:hypothetical protein [Xenorhabdus bovienii]
MPPIPIPAHLLADCLLLNVQLLTVIEQCNLDKQAIREIEESKQPQSK